MAFAQMEIASKHVGPGRMAVLAFLVPLLFALYTGHAWEDYYITYRASHNLATGHGLVFTPGERVQSFTSPLGTLLPALCAWITGGNHDDAALWFYRLICCSFLAGAVFLLVQLCNYCRLSSWGRTMLFGLLLTSAKIIDFTINGMESALMIFFAAWCLVGLIDPKRRTVWWLGLGFAGLMWTRPDAFVPGGALAIGWLIFGARLPEGLFCKQRLRLVAGAALVAALLYAPWFVWAWCYYGSPVPQTILAKGMTMSSASLLHQIAVFPFAIFAGSAWLAELFTPAYYFFGGWPAFLPWLSEGLALIASLYFLWPKARPEGRIASFALFLGGFYLTIIPYVFPWYFPVWELLAFLALAFMVEDAARLLSGFSRPWMRSGLRIALTTLLVVFAGVLCCTAREFSVQETCIERGGREQIGRWLRAHAAASDTVLLEPLGYIGYYSGLKTYDVLGLSSPEVLAVYKTGHRDLADIILSLQPAWLVLRPLDVQRAFMRPGRPDHDYVPVKTFSCFDRICATPFLPGRELLLFDSCFIVYRRQTSTTESKH